MYTLTVSPYLIKYQIFTTQDLQNEVDPNSKVYKFCAASQTMIHHEDSHNHTVRRSTKNYGLHVHKREALFVYIHVAHTGNSVCSTFLP